MRALMNALWALLLVCGPAAAGPRQTRAIPATANAGAPTLQIAPGLSTPGALRGLASPPMLAAPRAESVGNTALNALALKPTGAAQGAAAAVGLPTPAVAPAASIAGEAARAQGETSSILASTYDGYVKRGFELEYSIDPPPQGETNRIPAWRYGAALRGAAVRFGLSRPSYADDTKYNEGHKTAAAVDSRGREWKAVPELVDGRRYDGIEMITPALDSPREINALAAAHAETLAEGGLTRGVYSSMHVTYDVSHLIGADGDASRLVDAILFIESNWAKVYAAVSPVRYGSIINHYAVPMAIDHPGLLTELAAIPRAARTYDAVRSVFERYQQAEIERWAGHSGKAWKMRAANYGKIFGLQQEYRDSPVAVIEFRISDLPDPAFLPKLSDLFAALLTRAPPQDSFTPPFAGRRSHDVNFEIAAQDRGTYESFIASLDLDPRHYPFLGAIPNVPADSSPAAVARAALSAAARAALGVELGARTSADFLSDLASSHEARDRLFAVSALEGQDGTTFEGLTSYLMDDADDQVRSQAFEHLIENFSETTWRALQKAVRDASSWIRADAVVALAYHDDPRAAAMLALLIYDDNDLVRDWAWAGLSRHTTKETAAILASLLDHPDPTWRDAARTRLEERTDPAARAFAAPDAFAVWLRDVPRAIFEGAFDGAGLIVKQADGWRLADRAPHTAKFATYEAALDSRLAAIAAAPDGPWKETAYSETIHNASDPQIVAEILAEGGDPDALSKKIEDAAKTSGSRIPRDDEKLARAVRGLAKAAASGRTPAARHVNALLDYYDSVSHWSPTNETGAAWRIADGMLKGSRSTGFWPVDELIRLQSQSLNRSSANSKRALYVAAAAAVLGAAAALLSSGYLAIPLLMAVVASLIYVLIKGITAAPTLSGSSAALFIQTFKSRVKAGQPQIEEKQPPLN